MRSSKNPEILAHVNLYSVWADLCRAKNVAETSGSVATLKVYAESESIKSVRPAVLLTLWYITGQGQYSDSLKKSYPNSPEAGIVKGNVKVLSVPFWYFVPRAVPEAQVAETASTPKTTTSSSSSSTEKKTTSSSTTKESQSSSVKKVREQLGLFRNKDNADTLIKDLKAKGFTAYSYTETRASGTTYYIVVVDENKDGTMGKKLRAAGFDCYPVEY